MSDVVNVSGKSILARRQNAPNQQMPWELIAAAKSKSIQFVNELGETTSHSLSDPTSAPWRTSLIVSRSWTLNLSGTADLKRLAILRQDATAAIAPVNYALELAGSAADGGGTYSGGVWVENLQVQTQNLGVAEFTFQLRGDGPPLWTPAA